MEIAQARRKVARYRDSGILLDAQLLLIFLVGEFDPDQLRKYSRTTSATCETDFGLLAELVQDCRRLWVTPQILTEVDNLTEKWHAQEEFREWLRELVISPSTFQRRATRGTDAGDGQRTSDSAALSEHAVLCHQAVREEGFLWLGMADCSAIQTAKRHRLVVTRDRKLFRELSAKRLPAIDFLAIQEAEYGWLRPGCA